MAAQKHGMSSSSTYVTWSSMVRRCTNEKDKNWKHYGGRGITVCDRWVSFENFLADMGERPPGKLTLERIDNDKGYEASNCKWATMTEQANNRRPWGSTTLTRSRRAAFVQSVLDMRYAGLSQEEIAQAVGRKQAAISKILIAAGSRSLVKARSPAGSTRTTTRARSASP